MYIVRAAMGIFRNVREAHGRKIEAWIEGRTIARPHKPDQTPRVRLRDHSLREIPVRANVDRNDPHSPGREAVVLRVAVRVVEEGDKY